MSDEPKAAKAPWLPSEVQGWIRFFIIIGCLKWWGFDASTINQVAKSFSGSAAQVEAATSNAVVTAESAAITVASLEAAVAALAVKMDAIVTGALARQDEERRKRWTLSNDLARIEGAVTGGLFRVERKLDDLGQKAWVVPQYTVPPGIATLPYIVGTNTLEFTPLPYVGVPNVVQP